MRSGCTSLASNRYHSRMIKPRQRPDSPPPNAVRLQKALADAGLAPRRDCEMMILHGRVQVNGVLVVALPSFIDPRVDAVTVDGAPVDVTGSIAAASTTRKLSYILVNKPKGVIATTDDEPGRRNLLSLLPPSLRNADRLFVIGRLDGDSTGLLIVTSDGDLAQLLAHPRKGITKEYRVTTRGLAAEEQLQKLRAGMYLITPDTDGKKNAKKATMESVRILKRFVDRSRGDRTVLSVTLREGQNREIRRMLARVGLKARELERVALGPLRASDLKPGQAKLLGKKDIEKLRSAVLNASD
jgi:23S rRNA pseudouridine2605 synthase